MTGPWYLRVLPTSLKTIRFISGSRLAGRTRLSMKKVWA